MFIAEIAESTTSPVACILRAKGKRIFHAVLRTITIGRFISVQGEFVSKLANGTIVVRVGERIFVGFPVSRACSVAS